ncbi:MAG: ATP-binding protein [Actinobacteria bacterium]|nr:ATP-binding protein [Actinomycetota bacterium]
MLARSALHVGAVRGRYFRENFAQGGIDLVQIIPELVTNADAAISASGRDRGRIELSFGAPDPGLLGRWRSQTRALGVPALVDWRWELRCRDDGIGVNAQAVDRRLGALGELPEHDGAQRGLFGRGLRDVWLAQGAGRIEGVRDERRVESWFFPAAGDDPYAYVHIRDEPAPGAAPQTLVTVPLAVGRLPAEGRLRTLVCQLVQLRPLLQDPTRELLLGLPSGSVQLVRFPAPEPDPERPLLYDEEVRVSADVTAHVTIRRSAQPLAPGTSRATRLGGLVVYSGRAAHESTLASHEGRPGTRHLYGDVRCDALEALQRRALDSRRPQVLVKVDRSGLNDTHPVVRALYTAIDKVLAPIVADEERRANARVIRPTNALRARDQVGLRALNDALKNAFDTPGKAAFEPGTRPTDQPPASTPQPDAPSAPDGESEPQPQQAPAAVAALRFKQALVRLHPGERRGVSLLIDPEQIAPGTPVHVAVDTGLAIRLWADKVPEPVRGGWSRLDANLRCRVSADPGARLSVLAEAAGQTAELVVLVVRHHASGWVREIARNDDDNDIDATFDPETGVVTVYEGRREFKALEKAARKAGLPKSRIREYLPYRMLEVEVAANAVYAWAAQQILARRLAEERPSDPIEYAASVHHQAQALRYRAHDKLMRAFLDDDVFDGHVRINTPPTRPHQTSLLDVP